LTPKIKTGVIGLDEILRGGIIEGESVLVEGLPGTGKTTLGLHFIMQGIAEGQAGLIIILSGCFDFRLGPQAT
jgi:circadian clock protein KaiC